MLSFFRRASKSKIGTMVMAVVLLAIVAGFAVSDASNFGSGNLGFGMGSSTLAEADGQKVTDRDISDAMQRRLQQVRQQNPDADYATVARDFDQVLEALIDDRALLSFGEKYGFPLSKRLIDAEIAQIPQTRGLNGQFSEQAYQGFLAQQRLTDSQLRQLIRGSLLQRLLLAPVVANPRVPVGLARPYASMMLEAREGSAATIPVEQFRQGLNPTDADVQRFYAANRARYVVPEQRALRIARIGPDQVASVTPTDKEISDYYNANRATYGGGETRTLTQAVVPDRNTANQIAARAKAGGTLAAAAAPAGNNAAVSSPGSQTREAYASVAGNAVANAAFGAASGAVVGPIQSDFGWVVVKVESVRSAAGKSLADARSEIVEKLSAEKRKVALEELVDKVQTAVDDGSNFAEAAAQAKLTATTTPLIMMNGTSRANPGFRAPPELAPAVAAAFQMAPNDPPELVPLANDQGYALVAPQEVVAAAPSPLASIREQVKNDWIAQQATNRARAIGQAIAAKTARGVSMADAVRQAGVSLPAIRPLSARRLQIASSSTPVSPAIRTLFTLGQGKSQLVPDSQGRAFFVIKVDKIVPGNAALQPALISRMQTELQEAVAADYSAQFLSAIRQATDVRRNEAAIATQKQSMRSGS